MQNSNLSAGTAAQKSTNVDINLSSPTCTKPLVGGSFSSVELDAMLKLQNEITVLLDNFSKSVNEEIIPIITERWTILRMNQSNEFGKVDVKQEYFLNLPDGRCLGFKILKEKEYGKTYEYLNMDCIKNQKTINS